ncbi:sterol desaturase family protein [Loktanella sp. IMCC34160]|uniref:sterol desaturase family protein n=1 Tax=Loktanella sp. IMCC34160 TaxID=2510646 RepID=UPI00101C147D|nr:sterol desaturase family protein [Loktanella sp. IMCC34160]RYG89188.1 sterol desaturase family protein [Loktanella sp. IMCC34160]
MSDRSDDPEVAAGAAKEWNWNPALPIPVSPVFSWPPRPVSAVKWLASYWLAVSSTVIEFLLAVLVWRLTQPDWATMETFSAGWIATIWLRNLVLLTLVAGSLHLWLWRFRGQGQALKFDARDMVKDNGRFTFRNQVLDNMFWSLASGVTIWTGFEVVYFWLAANDFVPVIRMVDAPVWSALWLLLIPLWASFHFYWVHRLLHWPPIYARVHSLHHRNINVGPWSGMSMHPIEHLFYFSSVLIHLIVPSDPIHVIFHLYNLALNPAVSHSGFEKLFVKERSRMALGDFFHQLHHRYFECNYGTAEVPWDVVFGSFHNGTPEATRRIRDRMRKLGR